MKPGICLWPGICMNEFEIEKRYGRNCGRHTPIVAIAIANFGLVDSSRPLGGIIMRLGISVIVFSLCMLAGYGEVRSQSKSGPNGFSLVDKNGNIRKPADVRDTYQSLGAYTVLDPKGNQMHMTYASPGSAEV